MCHFRRPDVTLKGDVVTVHPLSDRDPVPLGKKKRGKERKEKKRKKNVQALFIVCKHTDKYVTIIILPLNTIKKEF